MSTRGKALQNTLFSSVGLYTEYVLGMVTSIIIARHLAPAGYGSYSLVIWLVGLGVAITNSGTASAAIKFIAELRGSGGDNMIPAVLARIRRIQRLFLLFVLVAGGIAFLAMGKTADLGPNRLLLLGFLEVAVILRSAYMLNIGICKGFENFRGTAVIAMISTPINLLMVLAAWWLGGGVEWLLAVFAVSSVIFFYASHRQVANLLDAGKEIDTTAIELPPALVARVRRHVRFAAMIVTLGFFVASEVEVLFLNLFSDSGDAGQFKVGYQLATGAALLVPGVFSAILLPMMAGALSQGREIAARKFVASTGYLALLAMPLAAFGLAFAGDVIHVLYGNAYRPAAFVFALCLTAAAISTVTQGGSSLLISADRQDSILYRVMASGALKILLDVILIHRYGLHGAVMAYFFGSLAASAMTMAIAIRVSGASIEWNRLFRISISACIAGAAAMLSCRGLPPLAAIIAGGIVLSAVYAALTLVLRCWTTADIEYMESLYRRITGGRLAVGLRLLAWARAHAARPGWVRS